MISGNQNIKNSVFFIVSLITCVTVYAQKDTSKPQAINIVSSYKPVLRNAVKINFSGSQLPADTAKTVRQYQIP